ncbi:hypothetical protein PM082_007153 [Marasmius tenuissimus]|nr:hypothetical protein PM082_007153 [Marasmius tenuissimus]
MPAQGYNATTIHIQPETEREAESGQPQTQVTVEPTLRTARANRLLGSSFDKVYAVALPAPHSRDAPPGVGSARTSDSYRCTLGGSPFLFLSPASVLCSDAISFGDSLASGPAILALSYLRQSFALFSTISHFVLGQQPLVLANPAFHL